MKKRVFAFFTALVLALSLLPAAALAAYSSFYDVQDPETARNVEVLRLMGVLQGDEKGRFNPYQNLTRAQFCKMTVVFLGREAETKQHRNRTIFPDVRATHWASGYVNLAVTGEDAFIHGMPNGTFAPEQSVTYGQAVTILMRVLGYTDKDCGPVWPDGYIDLAKTSGVSEGIEHRGSDAITRAEAAKLFVNALGARRADRSDFASKSDKTTLLWVDAASGRMRTTDNTYTMVNPMASTVLEGMQGNVILDDKGKALTFLPLGGNPSNGGVVQSAVVVEEDRSAVGFSALAGGSQDYAIYKNGSRISVNEIRRYDVATYSPETNSIQICDTRVPVYYENCTPSPREPAIITVLGGTELHVLPSAQFMLSQFRPGMMMTLLLTADGQVAGAIESRYYASSDYGIGIVSAAGQVSLICGRELIPLTLSGAGSDAGMLNGQLVSIAQFGKDDIRLLPLRGGMINGPLDPVTHTLGYRNLAEQVLVFDRGKLVSLNSIANGSIPADQISCTHTNASGEIDIIVLNTADADNVYYGMAVADKVEVKPETTDDGNEGQSGTETEEPQYVWYVKIVSGNGVESPYAVCYFEVPTGQFVKATLIDDEYVSVTPLMRLYNVPVENWIGTGAITVNGKNYLVPDDVPVYNRDTGMWMNGDLEMALRYARSTNVYIHDGTVKAVEVFG